MKYYNYTVNHFTRGHIEFITPCPHGMLGKYTHDLLMVGSIACQRCPHFHHLDHQSQTVACGFIPKQDQASKNKYKHKMNKNEKKDFHHPAYR